MAAPSFRAAGAAVAAAGTSLNVAYPSGIQAGDFLCLLALTKDNVEINTPAGWLQHATGFRNQGTLTRGEWFWKRAAGNESGTLAVTKTSGTNLFFARMYRFAGIPTGVAEPFEAAAQTGLTASAVLTPAAVVTLGRDRTVVCLAAVGDDNALGNLTGGTTTVPEVVAEATTTTGTDGALGCYALARSQPEAFNYGSFTMAAADPHVLFTFALLPAEEPVQIAASPGLAVDLRRHPATGEIQKVAWTNNSGHPATVTLWNTSGSQEIQVGTNETAEVAADAGYIFGDCGPNVNVRYR